MLTNSGHSQDALDSHNRALVYSVPQATIDMNTAEEVTDAEEETGNAFAIAIRCPTGVHFVKGTSAKEKQWLVACLVVSERVDERAETSDRRERASQGCIT